VHHGDPGGVSDLTVKAETRRLMVERAVTAPGGTATLVFTVNVRHRTLPAPPRNAPGGDRVRLNDREDGPRGLVPHWDEKLTLEFNGPRPCIAAVEIERVEDVVTVFLAGDSTVTDQPGEPSASWGQMLTRFLGPGVAVANHAESGETLKSFLTGLRLDKILSQIKHGDHLFIQFGHNDSKDGWPQTYVEAGTTYKAYLRVYIAEARRRGAIPVLVTSVQRRQFDEAGRIRNSHGRYPEAVREVAAELAVPLIDLERASVAFYEALGTERAPLAFAAGGRDATHHNNYGAWQFAKMVAQGIRDLRLELARHVVADFPGYDPARPDPVESFRLPASPRRQSEAPRGN
jgi:lysophospholipase L1-like esterase